MVPVQGRNLESLVSSMANGDKMWLTVWQLC